MRGWVQVENTNSDSFDLYYGLFMYNVNATQQVWGVVVCVERGRKERKQGIVILEFPLEL